MLTGRLRGERGTIVGDVIILPIYMFMLFATIFFMFYLRARVIMYEAAYLGLTVANNAVEQTDADAGTLGVEAAERFLDRINAVTVRRVEITRTRSSSLYRLEAEIEGGWEPGPLFNMAATVNPEVCLQADHKAFLITGVTTCPP